MIAFEIRLNGKKLCTAGINAMHGLLESCISWSKRDLSSLPEENRNVVSAEDIKITVGGQARFSPNHYESLKWKGFKLAVGDEVSIKIVETDIIDEPNKREAYDPKRARGRN